MNTLNSPVGDNGLPFGEAQYSVCSSCELMGYLPPCDCEPAARIQIVSENGSIMECCRKCKPCGTISDILQISGNDILVTFSGITKLPPKDGFPGFMGTMPNFKFGLGFNERLDRCDAVDRFSRHTDSPFSHSEQVHGPRFASISGAPLPGQTMGPTSCLVGLSFDEANAAPSQVLSSLAPCVGCPIIQQKFTYGNSYLPNSAFAGPTSPLLNYGLPLPLGPINVPIVYTSGRYTCSGEPPVLRLDDLVVSGTGTYYVQLVPFNPITRSLESLN
jgi:hypothetical protein